MKPKILIFFGPVNTNKVKSFIRITLFLRMRISFKVNLENNVFLCIHIKFVCLINISC